MCIRDSYQGIAIGGYTQIIEKMLAGSDVKTDTDYFEFIKENPDISEKTVYTGQIDEFFGYRYGALGYRSVSYTHLDVYKRQRLSEETGRGE